MSCDRYGARETYVSLIQFNYQSL